MEKINKPTAYASVCCRAEFDAPDKLLATSGSPSEMTISQRFCSSMSGLPETKFHIRGNDNSILLQALSIG